MKCIKKKRIIKSLLLDRKPLMKLNDIILQRHKYLIEKYSISKKKYNSLMIKHIIYDEKTRLVSLFKDQLIQNDVTEILKRYYNYKESMQRLTYYFEYYHKYSKLFPNYTPLPESKYIYKNIHKKQIIIDLQQMEKSTISKIEKNNKNLKDKVFDSDVYDSIFKISEDLYPSLFGINECKSDNQANKENKKIIDIVNYIEKCEKNYQNKNTIPNSNRENNNNSDFTKFKNLFKLQKNIKNENNIPKENNIFGCTLLSKQNTVQPLILQQQKLMKNAKLSIINNFYSNIDISLVSLRKKDGHKIKQRTNHSVIFKNINSLPPLINTQENINLIIKPNFNNCVTHRCNKYQINFGVSKLGSKNNKYIKSNKILPKAPHINQQSKKTYNLFNKMKLNNIINQFNLSLNYSSNRNNVTKDDLSTKNKKNLKKYIKISNKSKKYDKVNCISDRTSHFQRKNRYNFEIKKSQYSSNSRLKKAINKSQSRSQSKKNISQNKTSISKKYKVNSSINKISQLINVNLLSKIVNNKNNIKFKKNCKNLKDVITKDNNSKINEMDNNFNLPIKNLSNCNNTERSHLNRFNINRMVIKKIIFEHKNIKTKSKSKSKSNNKKEKLNITSYRENIKQKILRENTNIINHTNSLIKDNIFPKYKKINIKNHNERKSKTKSNKESHNSLSHNELYYAQFSNSIEIPSLINKKFKPIEIINNSNMNSNTNTLCNNSSNKSKIRRIKGIEIKNFKKIFSLKNENKDKSATSHKSMRVHGAK